MSSDISIRFLNEAGLEEMAKQIGEIRAKTRNKLSDELLFDERYSAVYQPVINIQMVPYHLKSELIPYIVDRLSLPSNKYRYFDTGLWSWLAAFYFENITASAKGGKKINEDAFYILKDPKDYTKYYRHLLAYPARIYSELGGSSRIFLIGDFSKRGEITEQFGASQEIALNKGILDAANIIYWDDQSQNLKRGAAGKGAGSARRLVKVIKQYQLTYDLNSMDGKAIVEMLPHEFEKWKS